MLGTRNGELLIPSVVLFADERTIVGREAQLRGRAHADRLAGCVKRCMGKSHYEHSLGGEWLPPEVIQACILRHVKDELGNDHQDIRAVIAVPTHFVETQRHTTAMAAEMAGLGFLDLVNESIAAALAFSEDAPAFELENSRGEPGAYLIFDLGGYTFEATLLSVRPGEMTMVGSDHDLFLGGHDWDLRLADLLAEPFIRHHGLDPREDPQHLDQWVQRARQAKHALSERTHTSVHLSCDGKSETVNISRDQFEHASGDLVAQTERLCDGLLQRAGLGWSSLRQVLLVGGATRMPMIRQMLSRRLGREVDRRVAPEEAVARGAAIYATRLMHGGDAPPQLQVTSISTHSLGIDGVDQATGKRVNKILIPKGTPLPAKVTREFTSKSNAQHAVVFNVLEGEHPDPAHCTKIGHVILGDLPDDVSEQWPVDVTYEYSRSGLLSVVAQARYTDRSVQMTTIRPAGVSQTHLEKWKEVVSGRAGFAAYQQVRAWERACEAAPPLVVAGRQEPELATEPDRLLAFLRRTMPFLFRRQSQAGATGAPANGSAADRGSST